MYNSWELNLIRDLATGYAVTSGTYEGAWAAAEAAYIGASSLPGSAGVQAVETLVQTASNNSIVSRLFMPQTYAPLVPYNSAVADAATLWEQYATAGEQISTVSSGAMSTGSVATSSGPTSLMRTPTGAYKPTSLLALELPTACAALAPLLGVGIGVGLYQDNPGAWSIISQRLLPFCYEGSTTIPSWAEAAQAAGEIILNALVPASILEALKQALIDANILTSEGTIDLIQGFEYNGQFYPGVKSQGEGVTLFSYQGIGTTSNVTYTVKLSGSNAVGSGSGDYINNEVTIYNYSDTTASCTTYRNDGTIAGGFGARPNGITIYRLVNSVSFSEYIPWADATPEQLAVKEAYENGEEIYVTPDGVTQWSDVPYYPQSGPLPQVASGTDSTGNPTFEDAYPVPLPSPLTQEQTLTDPFPYPYESSEPMPWPQPLPDPTIEAYRLPDPLVDIVPWPQTDVDPWPQPEPQPYPEPRPDPTPSDPSHPQPPGPPIGPADPVPPSGGNTGPTPLGPDILPPFGPGQTPDGLIAVYNPPVATLRDFAEWLWVTWPQAGLDKIWNNPFDGVINLFELYCDPPVIGNRSIRSGFLDSGIVSPVIDRYTSINCGSLIVPEYWNNYLDYAPYTQCSIYLPFIGIVNVDANDIVGHSVNITYNIDCYNGSFIAMITVAKEGPDGEVYNCLAYQYSGNCAVDLPLSGGSQANIKGALINATAVGIGGIIMGATAMKSGSLLSGTSDYVYAAEHALSNLMSARSSVQKSGSFGSSFGAMGAKKPYIMVKRPVQVVVRNYNELYGYPAHKAVTMGQCRGYVRCKEVHVESPTASDDEKNLITKMLKDGVWI